jgi:hypothetical protein
MPTDDRNAHRMTLGDCWPAAHRPEPLNHPPQEPDPAHASSGLDVVTIDVSQRYKQPGLVAHQVLGPRSRESGQQQTGAAASAYRLAWQLRERQLGVCGPPFGSLEEAQSASTEYNATRQSRRQAPCTHLVCLSRPPYGESMAAQKVLSILLLDGTVLPFKGKWKGSVIIMLDHQPLNEGLQTLRSTQNQQDCDHTNAE